MKQLRRKDNKLPIIGTKEVLYGCALIQGVDEHGVPVYVGQTDVWWDDQRTVTEDGGDVFIDEDGHEVLHHQVEEYDPAEEAE